MSGQALSRSSFSSTASRMKAATGVAPRAASTRARNSGPRRTGVAFVSEAVCSSGLRPIRRELTDAAFSAKPIIFPTSPIDRLSDVGYISDIAYKGKTMRDREMYPAVKRPMVLDEETVRELTDAAHQFRLEVQFLEAKDRRTAKEAQHFAAAERRLRLAINAVRSIPDDTAWAS